MRGIPRKKGLKIMALPDKEDLTIFEVAEFFELEHSRIIMFLDHGHLEPAGDGTLITKDSVLKLKELGWIPRKP